MVRCVHCTRSKKIQFCAFEFYTFFQIFINFKKSTLWHFNSFFCIFGPDKATRQGLSIAIWIVKDEDKFLLSFPHLTLVSPHLWYFTIYVVLSSQNDVGILFFSVYLKSKILHCFHFYFDIIQIKYLYVVSNIGKRRIFNFVIYESFFFLNYAAFKQTTYIIFENYYKASSFWKNAWLLQLRM